MNTKGMCSTCYKKHPIQDDTCGCSCHERMPYAIMSKKDFDKIMQTEPTEVRR